MGRKKKEPSLEELRDELLRKAEEKGVSEHYFFKTTFERYEMQLQILSKLKDAIESEDLLVEKTYVKDRTNLVINPAITEYNKTASAANGTVTTLVKILGSLTGSGSDQPGDLMRDFLES
jgi:hypothetical protein